MTRAVIEFDTRALVLFVAFLAALVRPAPALARMAAVDATAYVFPSYTLRRAAVSGTGSAADYVQSAQTEEVRLDAAGEAVGRVLVSTADLSASAVVFPRFR